MSGRVSIQTEDFDLSAELAGLREGDPSVGAVVSFIGTVRDTNHGLGVSPAMYVGGRCQIAERITLTVRLGYPTFAFGVSFML